MSDRKDYESTSLPIGLKDELRRRKGEAETYADVIHRALTALSDQEDRQKSRWEEQNREIERQGRLLVHIADEIGLDRDKIPDQMLTDAAKGDIEEQFEEQGMDGVAAFLGGGRSATSNEEISGVAELERQKRHAARMQAEKELEEQGELPAADSPLSGYGPDTKEKINERAKEIMAEQTATVEGWTDGFDHTSEPANGGNH